jgi:hypothetical protein
MKREATNWVGRAYLGFGGINPGKPKEEPIT